MIKFSKVTYLTKLLHNAPIIILFVCVLNEFDFNYLELKSFSTIILLSPETKHKNIFPSFL